VHDFLIYYMDTSDASPHLGPGLCLASRCSVSRSPTSSSRQSVQQLGVLASVQKMMGWVGQAGGVGENRKSFRTSPWRDLLDPINSELR
jgi:hypothetical protein